MRVRFANTLDLFCFLSYDPNNEYKWTSVHDVCGLLITMANTHQQSVLVQLGQDKLAALKAQAQELESQLAAVNAEHDQLELELNSIRNLVECGPADSPAPVSLNHEALGSVEEKPDDWLYPQYKNIPVVEVARDIFEANPEKTFSNAQVTSLLYDVEEDSEKFARARSSASATLRRGAESGLFRKVGRGYFQANPPTDESPQQADLDQLERTLGLGSNTTHEEYPQEEVVYESL